MHHGLDSLVAFYRTPIGLQVRRLVAARIRARWGGVRGLTVMGLGYCVPYLPAFRNEAARLGALVPDEPPLESEPDSLEPGMAVRVDSAALPLPSECVDRLLGVHFLEFAENRRKSLREIWRVLKPEGRLLLVVPNRRGLWAHREHTPFGQGEPYSRSQIEQLLDASMFTVGHCTFALAMPPVAPGLLWRPGTSLERLGCTLWPGFAGVTIVEATKRVTATLPKGHRQPITARLRPMVPRRLPLPNQWPAAAEPAQPTASTGG
jgi:SAM-dependent methyltransferase